MKILYIGRLNIKIIAFLFIFNVISMSNVLSENSTNHSSHFKTDIEGISENMIYSEYWEKGLTNNQHEILSPHQIKHQNQQLFQTTDYMNDLTLYPETLTKKKIIAAIKLISKIPSSNRYYSNGKQLTKTDYKKYQTALNINAIPTTQNINFAMVVKRSNLRRFPTNDAVFKTNDKINIDRFQESASFPTEVVAILHESQDKKWSFVATYNYHAWIENKNIAIATKEAIFNYKHSNHFMVITGDKVLTTYNPHNKNISEIQLDMGTKIQLTAEENIPTSLGGQNTYTSYVVNLPTRNRKGYLKFEHALISRNKDVHIGYLPFNKENIIKQSFKFLGERYGWGHSFNARDCTGFVGDVYKSFGILMPRNSGQQGNNNYGANVRFSKQATTNEKLKQINQLEVGDLIYIPGHVMMYLGKNNGKPYIIHDVSGLSYFKENGNYYKSTLNGVSVTPLLPLQLNQETSYIDRIYNLKKIK